LLKTLLLNQLQLQHQYQQEPQHQLLQN